MRGCDKFCSYCIVPFTRGREKCRSPQDPRRGAPRGRRRSQEVTLLGQRQLVPIGDWDFPDLLAAVAKVEGLDRVRFTTSHPWDFTRRLVDTIAAHPTICDHVHLPVQSGSDRILAAMRREHTVAWYRERVDMLREAIRGARCLRTSSWVSRVRRSGLSGHVRSHGRGAIQLRLHLHLLSSTPYAGGVDRRCAGAYAIAVDRLARLNDLQRGIGTAYLLDKVGHPVRARSGRGAAGEGRLSGWTAKGDRRDRRRSGSRRKHRSGPDHGTLRDHVARLDRAACPA